MSTPLQAAFLTAILGVDGATALQKAVSRQADLAEILIPRTVLSFVTTVQSLGYKGEIPGMPGSMIALTKSGGVINKSAFLGKDANAYTMAAHLALLLGAEADRSLAKNTRNIDLTRFGKSIDLLVKSRMIRKDLMPGGKGDNKPTASFDADNLAIGVKREMAEHGLDRDRATEIAKDHLSENSNYYKLGKVDQPGTTAKPQLTPPDQAQAPQKQPAHGNAKPPNKKQKSVVAPPRTPDRIPGLKATPTVKIPEMRVSKNEAHHTLCDLCGQPQFGSDGGFYGCLCLRSFAPYTLIKAEGDHYVLGFGMEWSEDARGVLLGCLHGTEGNL